MPNLRDSYRTILSDNFVLFRLLLLLSLLPLSLLNSLELLNLRCRHHLYLR